MLKSILRIQNLRRSISLRRPIINYIRYLTNFNERNSRSNLKKQSNDLSNLDYERPKNKFFEDDLVKSVSDCKNVDDLFYLIKPHVNKLTIYQLAMVYKKLKSFIFKNKKQKLRDSLRQSPVLRSLLDNTSQLTRQLSTKYLILLLEIFDLIDQDPKSPIVDSTFQEFKKRFDKNELKLNEIINLLKHFIRFLDNSVAIDNYFELNQCFIEICKKKLMKKFDLKDLKLINNYYTIFLIPMNDPDIK